VRLQMTEDQFRNHITALRAEYMRLEKPRGSFLWWLQVKLVCARSTAERVLLWWS
jgi:hypothetical protein